MCGKTGFDASNLLLTNLALAASSEAAPLCAHVRAPEHQIALQSATSAPLRQRSSAFNDESASSARCERGLQALKLRASSNRAEQLAIFQSGLPECLTVFICIPKVKQTRAPNASAWCFDPAIASAPWRAQVGKTKTRAIRLQQHGRRRWEHDARKHSISGVSIHNCRDPAR